MPTSVKQMMEAANAAVPKITPAQAREMIGEGQHAGGRRARRTGGREERQGRRRRACFARHAGVSRRSPESPYHDKNFTKDKTVILYCASGGRSALAAKVLKDLGYGQVFNVGAFRELGRKRRGGRKADRAGHVSGARCLSGLPG